MNHFHLNLSKDQELSTLQCLQPPSLFETAQSTIDMF